MSGRRAAAVGLGWAATVTAAALLIPHFRFEPDVASLFASSDPVVALAAEMPSRGTSARELFVVVRGERIEQRMPDLVRSLGSSPWIETIHATRDELLGEGPTAAAREAPLWFVPDDALDALDRRLSPEGRAEAIDELRLTLAEDPFAAGQLARRDPLGLRWIFDAAAREASPVPLKEGSRFAVLPDGDAAVIRVRGLEESFDVEFSRALLADLEERLAAHEPTFVGGYAIARADAARIRSDLQSSLTLSGVLVGIYLALTFRSIGRSLLVLLPVALAVFCGLPIGAALAGPVTPLAVGAAAILIGLGVDYSIHWWTEFDAARDGGRENAIRAAQNAVGMPLVLSFVTTAVAFASLLFGGFAGLTSFAALLLVGLLIALLATRSLVPLLIRAGATGAGVPPDGSWERACAALARRRGARRSALVGLVAVIAASIVGLASAPVQIGVDPAALRPADDSQSAARAGLEEELGFAIAPHHALVRDDVGLARVREVFDELEQRGTVAFSAGPHRLVPDGERAERVRRFRAEHDGFVDATVADLRQAGFDAEALRPALERFAALFERSPPDVSEPERLADGSHRRIITWWVPVGADADATRVAIETALPGADFVGPETVAERLGASLRRALTIAVVVTALGAGIVLCLALGWSGLLALLPVAVALPAVLAGMGVAGAAVDQATFVALPFLTGLGLDDGVHVVARWRRSREPLRPSTARAITRTSLTSVLAFGSLGLAESPGIAALGIVLAAGTLLCFVLSVLVLPGLLGYARGS